MFEKQVNRILNKVKKANILLGNTLSAEAIATIELDLSVTLPVSYKTYLSRIQNTGIGKTGIRKPQSKASIITRGLPKSIEQEMLEALIISQAIEKSNLQQNKIPLNSIF